MTVPTAGKVIGSILRYDRKQNSYKLALLRAINDVALAFPDISPDADSIAIPLRLLAERWVAYFWPFVAPTHPIWQGRRPQRDGGQSRDMIFRPALTSLRHLWEQNGGLDRPSDGFFLVGEMRTTRRRQSYSLDLVRAYDVALISIQGALMMPIRYAGPGNWQVFARPQATHTLPPQTVVVPSTRPGDICLVLSGELWRGFQELSLWIEALCIHEWCLFTETVTQDVQGAGARGVIYTLLTDHPANRRPLTWERNQIDILLMEGHQFVCPWTGRTLDQSQNYNLDHIVPIALYPINELWNLVPADPGFNKHTKRDLLPSVTRLAEALPRLSHTYQTYTLAAELRSILYDEVRQRFTTVRPNSPYFAQEVARAVTGFVTAFADARNVAHF